MKGLNDRVNKKSELNALLAPTRNRLKSLLMQIFWHCVIESSPSQRVCKLDRFLELLAPISKEGVTQLGGCGPEGNPVLNLSELRRNKGTRSNLDYPFRKGEGTIKP